ncbi:NAD-dependent epimerase/dehydratase family protein [Kordiimonas pumila]|uniref:NAD-dependent epimerase/dehydratase family protein n=1 Tax=Kordiimonas pumila TaxID=2161677 RepID=A0ABV7D073_9PROT|nr:SDR family oxidoreductase [Kordiimonas pumila]
MKILITGNMGYVGSVLIPHLAQAIGPAAELTGVDNGYFMGDLTSYGPPPEVCLHTQIFADVRNITASELEGFDAVVHLAAVSNDPIGAEFEAATYAINQTATIELAQAAKAAGVKTFVFASSCSVYGAGPDALVAEDGVLAPQTAYAISKVEAEAQLCLLAGDSFRVTCLRFATACGFSPRLRLDLVVNDFTASALSTGSILLKSKGNAWRPFIAVSDMARAIEWGLIREGAVCEVVNVGHDSLTCKISDLAATVSQHIGNVAVKVDEAAQDDKRSYRVDFSKFQALAPDHQPLKTFPEIIEELVAGLRAFSFADAHFRAGNLIRLNRLSGYREKGQMTRDLRWGPYG